MKIIINNAQAFKSKKLVSFFNYYNITLGHSIAYHPHGNGLAKSSNKSLVRIIKRILQENKRSWHLKFKFSLWAEKNCTKRSIGVSPYELVYGTKSMFPSSLRVPMMKLLQGLEEEPNKIQSRINQLISL